MTFRQPRSHPHWQPRAGAVVLIVAALLVGAAPAAQAHAVLVGTSPADGSTVAVVPARVTLTFNEPALSIGTDILVTSPTGQVQTGKPVLVDNTITERLQPGSPAGRYTVVWRVTSSDGHPVSGTFSFTATKASPGRQANATPTASTTSTAATSQTSAFPTTSPPSTRANAGGHEALWGVAAGAALLVLLMVAFIVHRARRTTPQDHRPSD